ncbi:YqhR family membrane protein [Aquibacillus rhizosphaerae]|uniref:YqhR family membrane protein n=1 Tax=Aquibacillus rhizosphaerae TaxID=3051431 RepID=A0ABT7L6U4_9BACI|nr:YqhR family membrane protein [Aquibacillus sp. LR5S19]MDL4841577.1 YqhR family membrane protein [Aquibacillus sp. LR5S19]
MDNQELEQNKHEKPIPLLPKALLTGFIGGVLWSVVGAIAAYFNFTSVSPASFILRSWLHTNWSDGWLGQLISITVIGLLSVLTAILYYGLLRKTKGIWPSATFGVALWFIVFYLLQPIFPNVSHMTDLDINTIVTTLCLFLLYGIFIGYSISYEYLDTVTKDNV